MYDLDIGFDEGIWAEPRFVADQNPLASAMQQQPQPVHVSELFKQSENDGNVVGFWRGDLVEPFADQLFILISEEFGETFRDSNVSSININQGGVLRRNVSRGNDQLILERVCDPFWNVFRRVLNQMRWSVQLLLIQESPFGRRAVQLSSYRNSGTSVKMLNIKVQ